VSDGVAQGQLPAAGRSRWRRWFPFWVLQATEIAVAFVFVDISIHVANGGFLVAAAVALAALAITAHGPLGIVRVCGQRLHVLLASVLAVLMALSPIIPALRPDIQGIIVLEFGAVGLFRVATLTRTDGVRAVRAGSGRRVPVIDTTATVLDPPTAHGAGTTGSHAGAPAAHGAGTTGSAPGSGARRAGRATSTVVASGKNVAAKYGPEAEEQVKATIRGIGKWAGKVSARLAPPEDDS
jgi:hypothetical protein